MSEMIERVARAICKSQGDDPDALVMVGEPMVGSHGHMLVNSCRHSPAWMLHSFDAYCAIAAMRESTDGMMFAGSKALEMEMQAPSATLMGIGFAAMIDAALKDAQ